MKDIEVKTSKTQLQSQNSHGTQNQPHQNLQSENQKLNEIQNSQLQNPQSKSEDLNLHTQNQLLQIEIQKMRQNNLFLMSQVDQLQKRKVSLEVSLQTNLSPLVQEGMNILRSNLFDPDLQRVAYFLFKKAADENNDADGCWRVAACLLRAIGVEHDKAMAKIYAKKAMDSGSVDGIFWFGMCQGTPENRFPFFKLSSDKNHLAGTLWVGASIFFGWGVQKDQKRGKRILEELFLVGERYITIVHGWCFEFGYYHFDQDLNRASQLFETSRNQPLSDCSVFDSWGFDKSYLQSKF